MELELKHLSNYLHYAILCITDNGNIGVMTELKLKGNEFEFQVKISNDSNFEYRFLEGIKPILRPLSDLTKEIEHNGEEFVPFLELYKISIDEDIEEYKIVTRLNDPGFYTAGIRVLDSTGEYKILSFSKQNGFATQNCGYKDIVSDRVVKLTMNQYQLWSKLYEWHFDVFGLIEKGLAVDINTLNKEK